MPLLGRGASGIIEIPLFGRGASGIIEIPLFGRGASGIIEMPLFASATAAIARFVAATAMMVITRDRKRLVVLDMKPPDVELRAWTYFVG